MIEIVNGERPPNFAEILSVFPMASNREVIFAYGQKIYNPSGKELPPALYAHERVHCTRQIEMGVEEWWKRYLTDGEFRYEEELLAHQAEWLHMVENAPSRQMRRSALKRVAQRLSGPLYGRTVTMKQAMKDIENGR